METYFFIKNKKHLSKEAIAKIGPWNTGTWFVFGGYKDDPKHYYWIDSGSYSKVRRRFITNFYNQCFLYSEFKINY